MTKRSQLVRPRRQLMLCAALAVGLAGSAMAQSAGTAKPASAADGEYGYSKWDVTPFFGWQWFQAFQGTNLRNYEARHNSGWLFGERFNFDATRKVSIEGSLTLGSNRLALHPFGQPSNIFATIPS